MRDESKLRRLVFGAFIIAIEILLSITPLYTDRRLTYHDHASACHSGRDDVRAHIWRSGRLCFWPFIHAAGEICAKHDQLLFFAIYYGWPYTGEFRLFAHCFSSAYFFRHQRRFLIEEETCPMDLRYWRRIMYACAYIVRLDSDCGLFQYGIYRGYKNEHRYAHYFNLVIKWYSRDTIGGIYNTADHQCLGKDRDKTWIKNLV